jgi:tetratricopeptide (TPR) repeat protein
MKYHKIIKFSGFLSLLALLTLLFQSCSSFNYKTYDEKSNENVDDPDPNYNLTLDENFQDFTSFMFIGNRIENFSTYFNTYFNAKESFDDAYEDYATRVLANYNERQGSIFAKPTLSQESIDKFNKAIEKASKVIQYHKSSQFMDKSVLLIGKSYYYLGDYLKAERKFSEFISKLSSSSIIDEALLYLAKTQLRLENEKPAIERLDNLIKTSRSREVVSESYQSMAEYYLNKKDNENAIKNFKKAIEFSKDNEFKAQMQFLVAAVTAINNPKGAAAEYDKVLDYNASFDLEYLARYNYAKNLILSNEFNKSKYTIEDLIVKYKDNAPYLAQISYLNGFYYEQRKDYKNANELYYEVIKTFPSTVPASDASFRIAGYYENNRNDYLNAYRYYKFSTEISTNGTNQNAAVSKIGTYKRYFELRSIITGSPINTDYDNEFRKKTNSAPENEDPNKTPGNEEGKGKGGSISSNYLFNVQADSNTSTVDSFYIKKEAVATAKFEIAELFLYNLNRPDSCEIYLNEAFRESDNYDFKAKVLFALSALYRNSNEQSKSDDILRQIVNEYPLSQVSNSSRRLLNLSVEELKKMDSSDSLYDDSQDKFVKKEYESSLRGFQQLISAYPGSVHIDKALYAAGWIYENVLMKQDSAYFYYSSLMKTAPNSEAAAMISQKVSEYESFNQTPIDTSGIKKDTSGTNQENIQDSSQVDPQQLLKEFEESNKKNEGEQKDDEQKAPVINDDGNMKKEEEIKVIDPSGDGK